VPFSDGLELHHQMIAELQHALGHTLYGMSRVRPFSPAQKGLTRTRLTHPALMQPLPWDVIFQGEQKNAEAVRSFRLFSSFNEANDSALANVTASALGHRHSVHPRNWKAARIGKLLLPNWTTMLTRVHGELQSWQNCVIMGGIIY